MAEVWELDKADKALQEINTHERECALRYERIEERLKDGSKRFDRLDEKIDRFGNRLWWIIGLIVVSILVPQFFRRLICQMKESVSQRGPYQRF